MTYQVIKPPEKTITLDSYDMPVAIVKEMFKLTPYLETPRDVVMYHEAVSKLEALLTALSSYRELVYRRPLPVALIKRTVERFCIRRQRNDEDVAIQLLNVIHFYEETSENV